MDFFSEETRSLLSPKEIFDDAFPLPLYSSTFLDFFRNCYTRIRFNYALFASFYPSQVYFVCKREYRECSRSREIVSLSINLLSPRI